MIENAEICVYAPKVFSALRELDKDIIDVNKALNMNDNWQKITEQFGSPSGSRSGEFFYFSAEPRAINRARRSK